MKLILKKRYILIKKPRATAKQYLSIYRHEFHWAICSSALYYLTLPLLIRYPSIAVDCGLSRSKWHLLKSEDEEKNPTLPSWPKCITKHKNLTEWEDRAKRFVKSSEYFPLKTFKNHDNSLNTWMQKYENKKIALIHLKTNVGNATAKATDASTYHPTIEFLTSLDYQLVFVGREKMPDIFKKHDILNYAQSGIANFANDIALFNRADLAITAGSGIWLLAECLNVPFLFINYWHVYRIPASKNCVCLPTLVQNYSGSFLNFTEQWDLYKNANDSKAEIFPFHQFEARNATDDEILAACQELIELKRNDLPLNSLQKEFSEGSDYYFGNSRVSQYFLQKHKRLLRGNEKEALGLRK